MNLADMLCYTDIRELSRIARNYDCDCSGNSKNELIQSILTAVGRREVFDHLIANLETEDIRFLNSLLFDRRDAFSLEDLVARANQTKFSKGEKEEWNPREMISRFKQRGWLFNGHSQQTKYLFRVPEDLKKRFSDTLALHYESRVEPAIEPPHAYRDEQSLLSDDIRHFLEYLCKQEVPLSADGYLYKRQLQQVLESFAVTEESVGKTAWRFGYGRRFKEYPARFSLIYDYCYFQGYMEEGGVSLDITQQGRERVAEGRREDPASVYRFWLKLYKGPIPNLLSLVYWIGRLAKGWVTSASLHDVLIKLIKPYYYDSPDSIYEQRLLQMLMHLGIIRIGSHQTQGKVIQVTGLGSALINGTYVAEEECIDLKLGNP